MAIWRNIKGASSPNGMSMSLQYDDEKTVGQFYQDEKPFLEQAKIDREMKTKDNATGRKEIRYNSRHRCYRNIREVWDRSTRA